MGSLSSPAEMSKLVCKMLAEVQNSEQRSLQRLLPSSALTLPTWFRMATTVAITTAQQRTRQSASQAHGEIPHEWEGPSESVLLRVVLSGRVVVMEVLLGFAISGRFRSRLIRLTTPGTKEHTKKYYSLFETCERSLRVLLLPHRRSCTSVLTPPWASTCSVICTSLTPLPVDPLGGPTAA